MTQTAAITNLILSGGFFIDFTNVMSAGFKVFRAAEKIDKKKIVKMSLCEGKERDKFRYLRHLPE